MTYDEMPPGQPFPTKEGVYIIPDLDRSDIINISNKSNSNDPLFSKNSIKDRVQRIESHCETDEDIPLMTFLIRGLNN